MISSALNGTPPVVRPLPTKSCSVYWHVTSCLLLVTSGVLLVASASMPRWLHMRCKQPGGASEEVHDYALWYVTTCVGERCSTLSYFSLGSNSGLTSQGVEDAEAMPLDSDLRLSPGQMLGSGIEVSTGFLLELIALSLMTHITIRARRASEIATRFRFTRRQRRAHADVCLHCTALLMTIVTAVCIFIPFERFAEINLQLARINGHTGCKISTPFGIIVLGFAGLTVLLSAIFNVRIIHSKISKGCEGHEDESAPDADDNLKEGTHMTSLVSDDVTDGRKCFTDPLTPGYSRIRSEEVEEPI